MGQGVGHGGIIALASPAVRNRGQGVKCSTSGHPPGTEGLLSGNASGRSGWNTATVDERAARASDAEVAEERPAAVPGRQFGICF